MVQENSPELRSTPTPQRSVWPDVRTAARLSSPKSCPTKPKLYIVDRSSRPRPPAAGRRAPRQGGWRRRKDENEAPGEHLQPRGREMQFRQSAELLYSDTPVLSSPEFEDEDEKRSAW
jgi:hypothetical protein